MPRLKVKRCGLAEHYRRVYLVAPRHPESFWSLQGTVDLLGAKTLVPNSALATLIALTPSDVGVEFVLGDENVSAIDLDLPCDLVAITGATLHAPQIVELCSAFRERGIPVALGGTYATLQHDRCQGLDEIEAAHALGARSVFFSDDNFLGNKAFTRSLLTELVEWNRARLRPLSFSTQITVQVADDEELLRLLADARFSVLFVGVETPRRECLEEVHKTQNLDRPLDARLSKEGRLTGGDFSGEWQLETNIVPKQMTREELVRGYWELFARVYDPELFDERLQRWLSTVEYYGEQGYANKKMDLREVRIMLRVLGKFLFRSEREVRQLFWRNIVRARDLDQGTRIRMFGLLAQYRHFHAFVTKPRTPYL